MWGCLVTTTPQLEGRSFGTNVMEAALLVLLDKKWEDITLGDYLELMERLGMKPGIHQLQQA